MSLRQEYRSRFEQVLQPLAVALEGHFREHLGGEKRVDRVQARAKGIDRFVAKAEKLDEDGKSKYEHPLVQIQDQVAARITVFYLEDIVRISQIVERYFRQAEAKMVVPDRKWEFGYFGKHYILLVPSDVVIESWPKEKTPAVFELQIKTLFQHAWSEAEHDLGYKPGEAPLEPDDERMLAFTSAQAWGADRIFDELSKKYQR